MYAEPFSLTWVTMTPPPATLDSSISSKRRPSGFSSVSDSVLVADCAVLLSDVADRRKELARLLLVIDTSDAEGIVVIAMELLAIGGTMNE